MMEVEMEGEGEGKREKGGEKNTNIIEHAHQKCEKFLIQRYF